MSYWFRKYSPSQPRDHLGRWTDGSTASLKDASDTVQAYAQKIGLAPGKEIYIRNAYWVKALKEQSKGYVTALLGSSIGDIVLRELGSGDWEAFPARDNKYYDTNTPQYDDLFSRGNSPRNALQALEIVISSHDHDKDLPAWRRGDFSGIYRPKM